MIREGTLLYPHDYLDLPAPQPCPFCGSKKIYLEKIVASASEIWGVSCATCGAELLDARTHTPEKAIELWDRRAADNTNKKLKEARHYLKAAVFYLTGSTNVESWVAEEKQQERERRGGGGND